MKVSYTVDHIEEGLGLLVTEVQAMPKFKAVLTAFLDQVQEIENMMQDLYYANTLSGSQGVQLDRWGRVLDEARDGLTDSEYQRFLGVKLLALFSSGRRDDIRAIVEAGAGTPKVTIQPNFPASYIVTYTAPSALPTRVRRKIDAAVLEATNSGIGYTLIEAEEGYFGFAEDPEALGFDDGLLSEIVGGA